MSEASDQRAAASGGEANPGRSGASGERTRALAWASVVMIGSIVLSRALGMIREMVIAHARGAGAEVDAYQLAFLVPDWINHFAAAGFLSVTLIPIVARADGRDEPEEAHRIASIVLTVTLALASVLGAIAWLLAPTLVGWLAPDASPRVLREAVSLTRIMIPAQLFFIPGGVLMAMQMARRRFAIPALAPVVYNLGIIVGGLAFGAHYGMRAFSGGVLIGAFVGSFALQVWGAYRVGFRYRPRFDLRDPEVQTYFWLTIPLALGLTMTFSTDLFTRYFGSGLEEGAISCLNYALKLMLVVVAVFGQGGGAAAYPFLARLAAKGEIPELNRLLARTLRRFVVPVICCSVLLAVLAEEVVRLIYGHGSFSDANVVRTTAALRGFLPGAFAWAGASIVARGWFACRNTLTPALLSTAGVVLALPIYVLVSRDYGVLGVALAASFAMIVQATALFIVWNRRTENAEARSVMVAVGKAGIAAMAAGVAAWGAREFAAGAIDATSFGGALITAVIATFAFTLVLLVLAPRLSIHELRWRRGRGPVGKRA